MSSYTFPMQSTKYILWQDDNGWRGYLDGYPEHEIYGESFEELQIKLWQLYQVLTGQEREREPDQPHHESEPSGYHMHGFTSTMHPPTASRSMSRAQINRRARVEQLMFAMISNR